MRFYGIALEVGALITYRGCQKRKINIASSDVAIIISRDNVECHMGAYYL